MIQLEARPYSPAVPDAHTSTESNRLRTRAILLAFTVLFFAGSLSWSARKACGFDELFTYKIAGLNNYGEIWTAIHSGIECNPPLSFLLAHWSRLLLGANEVAIRVPAMLGFWLMAVCLFFFVRRRTDTLHGLLALLFPFFTIAIFYATEARPYGIVLGATGAALLSWQAASQGRYRSLASVALAVSVATLVSAHYYAVYVPFAIAAGEAVRCWRNRRVDFRIWLALLAGIVTLAVWLPLITSARIGSAHFWSPPGLDEAAKAYRDFISPLWIAVLIAGLLMSRKPGKVRRDVDETAFPLHELVTCAILAAMPAVMFLAAVLSTNAYHVRYVLAAIPGLAILASAGMFEVRFLAPKLARLTVAVFACVFAGSELLNLSALATVPAPRNTIRAMYAFPQEPALPIAIANDDVFQRARHYLEPALANRCYFLTDLKAASQFFGVDTGERSLSEWRRFQTDNIVDYAEFVREHPDFYAIRVNQHGWLIQKLAADGAQLTLLSSKKELNFEAEEQMYFRVHMPRR